MIVYIFQIFEKYQNFYSLKVTIKQKLEKSLYKINVKILL